VAATVTTSAFSTTLLEAGENRLQVTLAVASGDKWAVGFMHSHGSSRTVTAATFDGNAMTSMGTGLSFGGDSLLSGFRYDVSAMSPGNYVMSITLSGTPDDGIISGYITAGSDTPTNWTTATGTSTTLIDISVTSAANGLTIWAISQDVDSDLTPNGGETEVYDGQFTAPSVWYYAAGYYEASSGTPTTSNIAMTSGGWAGVGLFVPAAGGGGSMIDDSANEWNPLEAQTNPLLVSVW
jgi:hypothetical protein